MDHPDKKVVVRITKDSQALTAVATILLIAILLITMSWTYWRLK